MGLRMLISVVARVVYFVGLDLKNEVAGRVNLDPVGKARPSDVSCVRIVAGGLLNIGIPYN